MAGNVPKATGNSGNIFNPYLEQISNSLAPGLLIRLPSQIPAIDGLQEAESQYRIVVSPSLATPGITVSIFTCKSESQACLLGSFSVDSPESIGDQEALQ
ncbi:MAG: ShlB/FhaC/HecB family hemolysin secretion/activation protein, partial [Moorea sp. SIO2B7]|nr:ShlB/FhaC/HecB family hemolysin secretion/activation protein [Moorena sp. SIO2B7]